MNTLAQVLVPGLAGGLLLAYVLVRLNRRLVFHGAQRLPRPEPVSTDVINMAHIQVVGVGGLGLVVMSAIVALYIPAVGLSLGAGFVLGTLLAAVLILRRKKAGPMPSSSERPGANTMLSIDAPGLLKHPRAR